MRTGLVERVVVVAATATVGRGRGKGEGKVRLMRGVRVEEFGL